ncbi:hypothetical protein KC19_VG136400 [Ceratodon purpureus]|uniref:Protein kinase domain-containing protein n=1 Tax=Ceratodon purpureus TaxID=3225 RepID=A0A8T0HQW2_CERPU|nr:hypothetical protein KC19_VG136400 [Ceratodon purpureus]
MDAMKFTITGYIRVALYQLVIVVGLCSSSVLVQAKSVRVGGDAGWTNADPATGLVPNYAVWAFSQILSVQDILEFHFKPGACSLFQVNSQAALDTCNFTGGVPIFDLNSSTPVNFILTAPGISYLGCAGETPSGVSHCQVGQKFAVNVHSSESRRQLQNLTPGLNASIVPSASIAPSTSESSSGSSNTTAIAAVVCVLIIVVGGVIACCWYQRKRKMGFGSSRRKRATNINMQEVITSITQANGAVTVFTLKELEKATENFGEHLVLGLGGFGTVYKGTLRNGMVHVAIKVSNSASKSGKKQLMNEISILSQTNHPNLVKLFGCCIETEVPILVYEYIPNGNLFEHLHRLRFGVNLNWAKRLQIASETADALAYLHFAAQPPIYHRDVKSANILLDNTFSVKVADFGISRLTNPEKTHVSTAVQGTPGYLDPEYFHSYHLTDKSDVYSFGVVLLELITSQKPLDYQRVDEHSLAAYALPIIKEGNLDMIVDPQLKEPRQGFEQCMPIIQYVAEVAIECLADKRKDRPTMRTVSDDLQSIKSFHRRRPNV